jgi:hypothetical protein
VAWVLDYLTDQKVRSIYRLRRRWHVNLEWRGGGRRRRVALVRAISGFHRGGLIGDHRTCMTRLTATWLKCRGTWHKTARCLAPVMDDSKRSGQSGHGGRTEQCLKLIHGGDLFTARRYPGIGEHESLHRRESRRRGRRRQGALHLRSRSVYCTIRISV